MTDRPRITDLSAIQPENFKIRNTGFLDHPEEPYELRGNYEATRRNIWSTRNHNLRRLMREFPIDEPLVDQCAHWMHAVAGRHFFEDANHRTAIAMLRRLLRENGIPPGEWDTERTIQIHDDSHDIRAEIESVRMDTLYEKDELFEAWREYFNDVLPAEYR